jgi:hypothetical protein
MVAVEEINAAGGVNGMTLVLDMQDSEASADNAVAAYGKLMDSGMNVSIGTVLSGEMASVSLAAVEDDSVNPSPGGAQEGDDPVIVPVVDPAQDNSGIFSLVHPGPPVKISRSGVGENFMLCYHKHIQKARAGRVFPCSAHMGGTGIGRAFAPKGSERGFRCLRGADDAAGAANLAHLLALYRRAGSFGGLRPGDHDSSVAGAEKLSGRLRL